MKHLKIRGWSEWKKLREKTEKRGNETGKEKKEDEKEMIVSE